MTDSQFEQIAVALKEFLKTEEGQYVKRHLNDLYGHYHHQAEEAKRAEDQVRFINRAAGVNDAMSIFTSIIAQHESGEFKKGQ